MSAAKQYWLRTVIHQGENSLLAFPLFVCEAGVDDSYYQQFKFSIGRKHFDSWDFVSFITSNILIHKPKIT